MNAYSKEMFLGAFELSEANELAASSTTSIPSSRGVLDCGATASAAPEAVARGLISSVLAQDRSTTVEIDQSARPYFRFGNGRWGRALCRVHLSSSASGQRKTFSLYTLPNPAEYFQADFDKSSLVPVLIGMDHLGPQGVGMMIDFATGLAMNTKESSPSIFRLDVNKKGHYVLDVVQYLTQGCVNQEGHAHVVVQSGSTSSSPSMEHTAIELYTAFFDIAAADHELRASELHQAQSRMWQLYEASQTLHASAVSAQSSMCVHSAPVEPPSTSSPSSCYVDAHGARHHRPHPAPNAPQGEGSSSRLPTSLPSGSQGPKDGSETVATHESAHPDASSKQCAWGMATLCRVQPEDGVHPSSRMGNDQADAGRASRSSTRSGEAHGSDLCGDAKEDRCGRAAEQVDLRPRGRVRSSSPHDHSDITTNRGTSSGNTKFTRRVLDYKLAPDSRQPSGDESRPTRHWIISSDW